MNVTPELVVVAVLFLILGWALRTAWDWLMIWLSDMSWYAGDVLRDLFTVIGLLVVVGGLGFLAVHGHWFGIGA